MTISDQDILIGLIQENEGIIHKVIALCADNEMVRKDLKQEVLPQSWKAYARFRGEAKFSTWLYKISLNTALTYRKSLDRQTDVTERITPEDLVKANKEHHELLYLLVRKLDKVDRMLMSLHLEGYGNKEMAKITGMTQNHVHVKIHRLKQQIIKEFKKY